MSIGLFTDKKHPPSEAEIREALGARLDLREEMAQFVRRSYPAAQPARRGQTSTVKGV